MASVFKKKDEVVQKKSVIEIVRDSLDVDANGVVRFRSRVGRGSGKAVEIPGSEFNEFVTLMVRARESHEALVEQELALQSSATTTDAIIEDSDSNKSVE